MFWSCCPNLLALLFPFTDVRSASWSETLPAKSCFLLPLPFIALFPRKRPALRTLPRHLLPDDPTSISSFSAGCIFLNCVFSEDKVFKGLSLEEASAPTLTVLGPRPLCLTPTLLDVAALHMLTMWLLFCLHFWYTRISLYSFLSSLFKIMFIISHLEFPDVRIRLYNPQYLHLFLFALFLKTNYLSVYVWCLNCAFHVFK